MFVFSLFAGFAKAETCSPENIVGDILTKQKIPQKVVGDLIKFNRIVFNLVGNAIKFTDQEFVTVDFTVQSFQGKDVEIFVSVRDTGLGIPEDKIPQLFQSFSQVDSSPTRRHGGTGLGLAISKNLVEAMGGKISVKS